MKKSFKGSFPPYCSFSQMQYQNKRPMFESFVVKSFSEIKNKIYNMSPSTFKGSFVPGKSFSQQQRQNQNNLLTLIASVCEKHNLKFGQLIEVIKKEDWFFKKDEEIIILIENFLKEYVPLERIKIGAVYIMSDYSIEQLVNAGIKKENIQYVHKVI